MVTDATKHYLCDDHLMRNLKEIRCVVLGNYEPGGGDDTMAYSFLVGERGNIIQTLPMNRYIRSPGSIMVGIFGKGEPKPAQLLGAAKLCAVVHSRAPRVFRLSNLMWSKDTMASLKTQVDDLVREMEPRPMAAFGIRVL